MVSKNENNVRKKLAGIGGAAIIASPFFGPGAPLIALAGASTLAATGLRSMLGKDVRSNQEESYSHENSIIPESPETSIARREPGYAADLLENISREEIYQETIAKGYDSANRLIHLLPEWSLDNAKGINLKVEKKRGGWFSDEEVYQIRMRIKR